ncbi:MAG: glycosyltransferase family A protein, partial [Planctomycetota bacterium]
FVELASLETSAGRAALEKELGGIDGSRWIEGAARTSGAAPVSDDARQLLADLRRRAGGAPPAAQRPRRAVSAVAIVDRCDRDQALALATRVAAQRDVESELLVFQTAQDARALPPLDAPLPLRVLQSRGPSRGSLLRRAASEARHGLVALIEPDAQDLPWRFVRAAAALESSGASLVTSDYFARDEQSFVDRVHPSATGALLPAGWQATLVARAETLQRADDAAFRRAELTLLHAERAADRAHHVSECWTDWPSVDLAAQSAPALTDATLSAFEPSAPTRTPELSVCVRASGDRAALRSWIEAWSRQHLAPERLELVVVAPRALDPGLSDAPLPVAVRFVDDPEGESPTLAGLNAARAAGVAASRGALTLLTSEDGRPAPDCAEQHLLAHARLAARDRRAVVVGELVRSAAARENALLRTVDPNERSGLLRCGNASAPTEALREALRHELPCASTDGADAHLGLACESAGLELEAEPRARVECHTRFDLEALERDRRAAARDALTLATRWPAMALRFEKLASTAADAEQALWDPSRLERAEAAARELARVDLGGFDGLGEEHRALAQRITEELGRLVADLVRQWTLSELRDRFRQPGAAAVVPPTAPHRPAPRPIRLTPARSTRSEPDLSVVIPTHGRPRELRQCVLALEQQSLGTDRFEVIVVDDGSATPATEALAGLSPSFPLEVLRQNNAGACAARNLGNTRARAGIVVYFNDDALPLTDCLERHLTLQRADREGHAVMGRFPLHPNVRSTPFQHLIDTTNLLFAHPLMKSGVLYHGAAWCTGNLSVRRSVLEASGGFGAGLWFAEDCELGYRLERDQGLRIRYDRQAVALHDHELDLPGYLAKQVPLAEYCARIAILHDDAGWIDPSLWGRPTHELPTQRWLHGPGEELDAVLAEARALAALDRPVADDSE